MADNDFDIQYVANLARIALSPEEEAAVGVGVDADVDIKDVQTRKFAPVFCACCKKKIK